MEYLPDQPHIDRLAASLWTGREYGRASVMVGAGFSRNARPLAPVGRPFPLWSELAGRMYDGLYPVGSTLPEAERLRQKAVAIAGTGALQVASEYEAQFGRNTLDGLLTATIPDADYDPSPVHSLLLSLPWADVLTTNYDTLLERATAGVPGRRYEVVNTVADLALAARPRIIKLHGSFPSHRPFVLTEEDFRTYPRRCAAFVNVAQQAIAENVLCLLGFSGDDPNFLVWSGWVRDQLGPQMPNIYLVGLLNLAPSRRRVLEDRNVTPVDLSPLFDTRRQPDRDVRHRMAVEWFLHKLLDRRPVDPLAWPEEERDPIPAPTEDIAGMLPAAIPAAALGGQPPNSGPLTREQLDEVIAAWQRERLAYPGWHTIPFDGFRALYHRSEFWIRPVLQAISALLKPPDDVLCIAEVAWRLSRCLLPLAAGDRGLMASVFTSVLNQFDPFSHARPLPAPPQAADGTPVHTPDQSVTAPWPWERLREAWVTTSFTLLSAARASYDAELVTALFDGLRPATLDRVEWRLEFSYQQALWHLANFRHNDAWQTFADWPPVEQIPYAGLLRASIAYQIGLQEDAATQLEATITEVRRRMRLGRNDHALLSQEAWAIAMLRIYLGMNFLSREHQTRLPQLSARLSQLEKFGCSPIRDLRQMSDALLDVAELRPPAETVTRGFDPEVLLFHSGTDGTKPESAQVEAIALLSLCEQSGWPVGNLGLTRVTLREWVMRIARLSDALAIHVLARHAGHDANAALDDVLSRSDVAVMPDETVELVRSMMVRAAEDALSVKVGAPTRSARSPVSPAEVSFFFEVLSRIAFRVAPGRLDELLSLAERSYSAMDGRDVVLWGDSLGHLFQRIGVAYPATRIGELVARLAALPFASSFGAGPTAGGRWTDPLFRLDPGNGLQRIEGARKLCEPAVAKLLSALDHATTEQQRLSVVQRLIWLSEQKLLVASEEEQVGRILWSNASPATGLPVTGDFYAYAYLTCPCPDLPAAREAVRRVIVEGEFRPVLAATGVPRAFRHFSGGDGVRSLTHNLSRGTNSPAVRRKRGDRLVTLDGLEAASLLAKAESWWSAEETALADMRAAAETMNETDRHALQSTVAAIGIGVLAFLSREGDGPTRVRSLLGRIEASGLSAAAAWPGALCVSPDLADAATRSIRRALVSGHRDTVYAGGEAYAAWVSAAEAGLLPPAPESLRDELVRIVLGRREPGLNFALVYLVHLLRGGHRFLAKEQVSELADALDALDYELVLTSWREGWDNKDIPKADVPLIRAETAVLAVRLKMLCEAEGWPVPKPVNRWVERCSIDVLPEVRVAQYG